MDEFLKVAITACIPAFTVIFGWGVNKAASIANSYVHNPVCAALHPERRQRGF